MTTKIEIDDLEGCKMLQRIITAIILLAITIPALLLGGMYMTIYIIIVALCSGYELVKPISSQNKAILYVVVELFLVLSVLTNLESIMINFYLVVVLVVILASMHIFIEDFTLGESSYVFFISFLIAQGLKTILYIDLEQSKNLLALLGIATYGCDTFAYFGGMTFGKNKLIERLSPNKTIEGSISGIVFGSLLAIWFGFMTNLFDNNNLLIVATIILTFTGQIGDLLFSSVKRLYGIKDFSNILPGHGGVLDRIDSIVFNSLVLTAFLMNL